MQHGTKSCRERREEQHARMARPDDIPVTRMRLEIQPVHIEAQNRADGNHLRGEGGSYGHEGHKEDGGCASFAGDGDGGVGEDKAAADFRGGHSLFELDLLALKGEREGVVEAYPRICRKAGMVLETNGKGTHHGT